MKNLLRCLRSVTFSFLKGQSLKNIGLTNVIMAKYQAIDNILFYCKKDGMGASALGGGEEQEKFLFYPKTTSQPPPWCRDQNTCSRCVASSAPSALVCFSGHPVCNYTAHIKNHLLFSQLLQGGEKTKAYSYTQLRPAIPGNLILHTTQAKEV